MFNVGLMCLHVRGPDIGRGLLTHVWTNELPPGDRFLLLAHDLDLHYRLGHFSTPKTTSVAHDLDLVAGQGVHLDTRGNGNTKGCSAVGRPALGRRSANYRSARLNAATATPASSKQVLE